MKIVQRPIHMRGFSLLEILIVVFVLGLLSSIAIPNMLRVRMDANEKSMLGDIKTIRSALENYRTFTGMYPDLLNDLVESTPPYLDSKWTSNSVYISASDPTPVHGYLIAPLTGRSGNAAFYDSTDANNSEYAIRFVPEEVGVTANKNYCLDTSGVIFEGTGSDPIIVGSGGFYGCSGGSPIA